MAALCLTVLFVSGAGSMLLALVRMEETMNQTPYTVFAVYPDGADALELTLLGTTYVIDLSGFAKWRERASDVQIAAPPQWRILEIGVEEALRCWDRMEGTGYAEN